MYSNSTFTSSFCNNIKFDTDFDLTCNTIERTGATIHTENGLMLYAKKRAEHSVTNEIIGQKSSATRSHTPSELKYLVAAEEVPSSAAKCPMSKFT